MKLMQRTLLGFYVTGTKIDDKSRKAYFKDPDKFREQFGKIIDKFFPDGIPMEDIENGIKAEHIKDLEYFIQFAIWFESQFKYELSCSKKTGNYMIELREGKRKLLLGPGEETAMAYCLIRMAIDCDTSLSGFLTFTPAKWFGEPKISMEKSETYTREFYDYHDGGDDDDESSEDDTVRIGTF